MPSPRALRSFVVRQPTNAKRGRRPAETGPAVIEAAPATLRAPPISGAHRAASGPVVLVILGLRSPSNVQRDSLRPRWCRQDDATTDVLAGERQDGRRTVH